MQASGQSPEGGGHALLSKAEHRPGSFWASLASRVGLGARGWRGCREEGCLRRPGSCSGSGLGCDEYVHWPGWTSRCSMQHPLWVGAGPLSAAWPGQAAVVCGHLSHGNTLSLSDGARVAPPQGTGIASDSPPARTGASCLAGEGPDPQHLPVWWAAWPAMQWGCRAVSWGLVNRPGTSGPPLRVSQPPKPEIWALNQSLVLKHQLL